MTQRHPSRRSPAGTLAVLVLGLLVLSTASADAVEADRLFSKVDRVTIHRDLVSVERVASTTLAAETPKVVRVVVPMAAGVVRDSIRVTADATVRAVDVVEVEGVSEAATELRALEDRLALAELERDGVETDLALFESIAERLVGEAAAAFGTLDFDLDLARRQLESIRSDRTTLMRSLLERGREIDAAP